MTAPTGADPTLSASPPLGAYGLALSGLPEATIYMQSQPTDAPSFSIEVDVDASVAETGETPPDPSRIWLTSDSAQVPLVGGGHLAMERGDGRACFTLSFQPTDDELLHPYLAPAAALFWQWAGKEALHAGVFAVGDNAVLMVGNKEAGKSTTLSWLAAEGVSILSDDLAITDGATVKAGPRAIDLRPDADSPLPLPATRTVRGDRQRLELPPSPDDLRLRGVVHLQWGTQLEFTPVSPQERLTLLSRQRTFYGIPANPVTMLDLGALPAIQASRPRDMGQLPAFCRALLDYFA